MPESTTPALDTIRAPFTAEQVDALNEFQSRGGMHPFTCGNDHDGVHLVLIARADGWHCSEPPCAYRQVWAHAFMANPDAWPKPFWPAPGFEPAATASPTPKAPQSGEAVRCSCGGQGIMHLHSDDHRPLITPSAGRATMREAIAGAVEECRNLTPAALADTVMAAVDAGSPEHAAPRSGEPATDLNEGMRQAIAGALHAQMPGCTHDEHGADCGALADEAIRVRDNEMDRLRAQVQRQVDAKMGVAGQWGNALVDLATERTRAEEAEAHVKRLADLVDRLGTTEHQQRAVITRMRELAELATHHDDVPQDRLAKNILTALAAPHGPAGQGNGGGK
jgi:hypothetical protein